MTMSRFFAAKEDEQIVFTAEDAFVDEQDETTITGSFPMPRRNRMEPIMLELSRKLQQTY